MKYFTKIKDTDRVRQITASEARRLLSGYWKEDCLDDIFVTGKRFKLWTAYSEVWTVDENGNALPDFGITL